MSVSAYRLPCFKAYDIRGRVPSDLNPNLAYLIGLAYAERFEPQRVAIGHDVRLSSRPLLEGLALGLGERGVDVLDLGLCGTEEVYWAAQQDGVDGAIEITASHNPADYNGMKLIRGGALPISGDSGLRELETMVALSEARLPGHSPRMTRHSFRDSYVRHLLGYVNQRTLRPLRVVVNAGNGAAGPLIDAIEPYLPFKLIKLNHQPDGTFPNGVPNPLLNMEQDCTGAAIDACGADLGVAWDGDFDRCFIYDERGELIPSYYIIGLLAEMLIAQQPASDATVPRVIHDPRLTWNTIDVVTRCGGDPIQVKTGHAFVKERMRETEAIYGGEMSGHHYFRDFGYCDNGMIPWLMIASLLSICGRSLSDIVSDRIRQFPISGEINREVRDVRHTLDRVESIFSSDSHALDYTDGISVDSGDWRFNLRASNTEPLIRLNVESRGDIPLLRHQTQRLLRIIEDSA